MAHLIYSNIRISGISVCVPKKIDRIADHDDIFTEEELSQFVKQVGVAERRFADGNTCTSDLCCHAAERLLESMDVNRDEIDLVVFVTQTPDYAIPATSCIIQDRLKLPKATAAFDVNLGCSGYVYGLSIVYSFLHQQSFRKALLVVGDTPSKTVNFYDKSSCLLFGDGGSATIVEKSADAKETYFSLHSDGSGYQVIIVYGGASRNPLSEESLIKTTYPDGNIRRPVDLTMSGPDVFNFTIREVPKSILNLLEFAETPLNEVDYLIYHQANRYINDFLAKKLKYPKEKVPYSLNKFGNTSSASIPLTMVTEIKDELMSRTHKIILSGFGVGLSWANALLDLENCHIPELLEI
ncbi:MAG: ketoacyl-ACP synthase III [Syntrophales bacterium]|nr:ketoacyl-ACP synthase III [Syntrophales bacterium]MDD5532714.1 ketoacyl-ACP synthase III [Syntrophales bacterium]